MSPDFRKRRHFNPWLPQAREVAAAIVLRRMRELTLLATQNGKTQKSTRGDQAKCHEYAARRTICGDGSPVVYDDSETKPTRAELGSIPRFGGAPAGRLCRVRKAPRL